jgi:hypothetical protein
VFPPDWPITFWILMLKGCWLVMPCVAIPDWAWYP